MTKIKTINLKGNEYAQVKERIKAFREDTTKGSIDTGVTINPDGTMIMKATIVHDVSDEGSKRATGQAFGKVGGQKEFEKLETIAVGRALAFLGYSKDGEISSSEEMEEYIASKIEKQKEDGLKQMKACKTEEDLKKVWASIPGEIKGALEETKNELKAKLSKPKKNADA